MSSENDLANAARVFHKIFRSIVKDECKIIKQIYSHTKEERQEIKKKLEDEIKSTFSGQFLKIVISLFETTAEYEAHCLHNALKDYVHCIRDIKIISEILCTKTPIEIKTLSDAYKKGKLFKAIALGNRDNSRTSDEYLAKLDVKQLINAESVSASRMDQTVYINILTIRSFPQLVATFDCYNRLANLEFEKTIKLRLSGSLEVAFLSIIKAAKNIQAYFAEQIFDSLRVFQKSSDDLIRILVARAEIDLSEIKIEFKKMYQKSLTDSVKSLIRGENEVNRYSSM